MSERSIFKYMDLLTVQLADEINESEIEKYFPQTILKDCLDFNLDYVIDYNLSQYKVLEELLPFFENQSKKYPFRSASAISKNINGWRLNYFFANRYSDDYFIANSKDKIYIISEKYDSNIVIRILNELIVRKLLEKGYFPIHASAIVNLDDGKADLFFGGKGSGKSTIFFEKTAHDSYLPLANDICFVGIENEQAVVYSMTFDITVHKSLFMNNNSDFIIKDDKARFTPLQFCKFIDKSWIYKAPLRSLNYTALNLNDNFEVQKISPEIMLDLLLKYGKDRDFVFDDVLNINNLAPVYDYVSLVKYVPFSTSVKGNIVDDKKSKNRGVIV